MDDECKPNREEFDWAVCLFNNKGEDRAYFVHLYMLQETMKNGQPGQALVCFLNHWNMRLDTDTTVTAINKWYTDKVAKNLQYLTQENLSEIDLNKGTIIGSIIDLYRGLYRLKGIKDTGASKILHLFIPELFVMWDNPIRQHYIGDCKGPGAYILFMKKMQEIANHLRDENGNIFNDIYAHVKEPLEDNLKTVLHKKENIKNIMKFIKENRIIKTPNDGESSEYIVEKTITQFVDKRYSIDKYIDAKFIDEYNWIVFTKKCIIPPVLHP